MAIFGNLKDFPLHEIISVIGARTGTLTIEDHENLTLHIQLINGRITKIRTEELVRSKEKALKLLMTAKNKEGRFHFSHSKIEPHPSFFSLDIRNIPSNTHEIDRSYLPHPQTRFILVKSRNAPLPKETSRFLENNELLLEKGASAEQISNSLQIPLLTVQTHFYHLRLVNKLVKALPDNLETLQKKKYKTALAKRLIEFFSK